jgi:hypothetical protein
VAAKRSISVSNLLARQIEILFAEDDSYQRAKRAAFALLEAGFHLNAEIRIPRDELHNR